jgi:hypothetical protein
MLSPTSTSGLWRIWRALPMRSKPCGTADEPAPELFEDWLVDVAPESEYALERDLADLYDNRPEIASGLWGLVVSMCRHDDSGLSPGLVRIVKSEGKGYQNTAQPDTNRPEVARIGQNGKNRPEADIPPAPNEAY